MSRRNEGMGGDERRARRLVGAKALCAVVTLILVASLALVWRGTQDSARDRAREAADVAVRALHAGDLVALDNHLSAHRGQADFAYFFAARATPRDLGDALATVAGPNHFVTLDHSVDPQAYELTLTDLGGTLALATYGTADNALPPAWTKDFVAATTDPTSLATKDDDDRRLAQDVANKQNLLLLLARGYWSTDFLKAVTSAFWDLDHDKDEDAWPGTTFGDGKYAPAPNGVYLTDGVLALTAALTANPAASAWAFTDFQPGSATIDGSDHEVGRFTHFLLFEHRFPDGGGGGDDTGIGMTATLTALSSAIDARGGATIAADEALKDDVSPIHDSVTLQALAHEVTDDHGCSLNPLDYVRCVAVVAEVVWNHMREWGHSVLDILTLATFAPPPFDLIGLGAAATNATWYAIEGDYTKAGLALAAAVPGLAFTRLGGKAVSAVKRFKEAAPKFAAIAEAAIGSRGGAAVAQSGELSVAGAARVTKSTRSRYAHESDARSDLVRTMPGSLTEVPVDPECTTTCSGGRLVDVLDPATRTCIEVKRGVGATHFTEEGQQVAKDVLLMDSEPDLLRLSIPTCNTVEWHFFPDEDGKVGPHGALRELLQKSGIPYVMYVP